MARSQATSQEGLFFSSVAEDNSTSVDALLRGVDVNTTDQDGQSALHVAAQKGSAHMIKQLLDKSANYELSDRHGMTPLMYASQGGHIDAVKQLFSKDVDVRRRTGNGEPAVFFALMSGHIDIAEMLESKASCLKGLPEQLRMSILEKAVNHNQKPVVDFMIKHNCLDSECNHRNLRRLASLACSNENSSVELLSLFKVKFDQPGEDGSSILCRAVKNGLYDKVDYIVKNGCDVRHHSKCVQEAVQHDRLEILKLLVSQGAQMYAIDSEGYSPLQRTILNGSVEMFRHLFYQQNCSTASHPSLGSLALIAATKTKDNQVEEILKEMIQGKIPVDEPHPDTHDTPLLALCQKGPIEAVNLLLKNQCNGSARNKDDITPALQATKCKNENILRLLGDHNAALDIPDKNGETPIMRAGRDQSLSIVRYLAKHSCSLHGKDAYGMTIAHYAAKENNFSMLKFLQEQKTPIDVPDCRGVTPLMVAIDNWKQPGGMEIFKLLVSGPEALNINQRDWNGKSAIQHAVGNGQLELVRFLKANGADMLTIDQAGNTLLLESMMKGNFDILSTFLIDSGCDLHASNDEQESPVHYACKQQSKSLLMSMLNSQVPADTKDKKGITPFMISSHGNDSLVLTLRSNKNDVADVNKRTLKGRNATHMAALSGSLKVLESFLMFGCAFDQEDNNGDTPLILACSAANDPHEVERPKIAGYLIKHGANPNAVNRIGRTAIHYACEFGSLELIGVLLEKGANLNVPDAKLVTPFMLAAIKQNLNVLKYLVEKGANSSIFDSCGRTALHYAVEGKNDEVIKFLVTKQELDPNAVDSFAMSPVMISIKVNSKSTLDELKACGAWLWEEFNDQEQNLAYFACSNSNFELLKELKSCGISLCSETKSKHNCLTVASSVGCEKIVEFLFEGENKPLVDHQTMDGNTALMCAAKTMHLGVISTLLLQKATVHKKNCDGRNVLHILCSSHDQPGNTESSLHTLCELIPKLINSGVPLDDADNQGKTGLHLACETGNRHVAELLINKGAALNQPDIKGETPIFCAIRGEKVDVVKLLLQHQALIEVENNSGETPLSVAVELNNPEISQLFSQAFDNLDVNKLTDNLIVNIFRMHDLKQLDKLLSKGFDGTRNNNGTTLLHRAVKMGDAELLRSLVNRKNEPRYEFLRKIVDHQDDLGNTPLHIAIRMHRLDMADLLFEFGLRTDVRNLKGFMPFHVAVSCNKLVLVQWFYEKQESPFDPEQEEPAETISPLHLAAIRGNISIFKYLESKGFKNTRKCSNGNSCAHYAAIHGNLPILQHIEAENYEVMSQKNKRNLTPFHYAVLHGNTEAAQFLYTFVMGGTFPEDIVHFAVLEGHQHMVEWLQKRGVNSYYECPVTGKTSLWYAFASGNSHLVEGLLPRENFEVLTKHDDSLAHAAARANHAHLLRLLKAGDAQLDNVNKDGNTPVLDCAQLGNYESLKLLLELQCNIRRVNLRHRSIVHLACILGMQKTQNQEQRLKILQLAFNERLDMDVADSQGNTALMYASHYGLQQLVSFLLDTARCDPNASNKNGTTAVHLATKAGHTEVLKILDKRKANLQATDSRGTTPIMIAVYYQRLEALKYLLETNFVEGAEDTSGRSLKTLAAFTSNAIREQLEKKAVQIDPIAQQPDILLENGVGFDIDTELCDHPEFQAQSNVDENEDPEILPDESVAGTNNYIIPCRTGVSQGHQTIDSVSVAPIDPSVLEDP